MFSFRSPWVYQGCGVRAAPNRLGFAYTGSLSHRIYFPRFRAARQRSPQTETRRARSAAAKREPEIEAIITDLQPAGTRVGDHLRHQEHKGQNSTGCSEMSAA